LLEYLPQQLTESGNSELVRETVVKLGAKSMKHIGKVKFSTLSIIMDKLYGKLFNEKIIV
jgi:uncharacterized protein YqeY